MRHGFRSRTPKLNAQWRAIYRHKFYDDGNLADAVRQYQGENEVTREALYLELVSTFPHSARGTQRKWRQALCLPRRALP